MIKRKDPVNKNLLKKVTDASEEKKGCVLYYPDLVAQYEIYNKRLVSSPKLDISKNNLYIKRKVIIQ